MPKRKVVLDEFENRVVVGVQRDGCDPHDRTVEGSLEEALALVPEILVEAEEKWQKSQKYPAYKPPTTPKAASKTTQKADELPLLANQQQEKATPVTETATPVTETAPSSTEEAPSSTEEAPQPTPDFVGDKAAVTQSEAPATEEAEAGTEEAVAEPTGAAEEQAAAEAGATAEPAPSPQPVEEKAPVVSGWEYWLKDDRGPFVDVQAAMDEMGLDKQSRPHHNRWDRLSTSLKEQILRKPKRE